MHERIRHTFDAYVKHTLRNAARDYGKARSRYYEYNLPLDDYMPVLSSDDLYYMYGRAFFVLGQKVVVHHQDLAEALEIIPRRERTVVLSYYFLSMADREIGVTFGVPTRTANYIRNNALKQLREVLTGVCSTSL